VYVDLNTTIDLVSQFPVQSYVLRRTTIYLVFNLVLITGVVPNSITTITVCKGLMLLGEVCLMGLEFASVSRSLAPRLGVARTAAVQQADGSV
jgi:hypothetical protein